LPVASFRDLDHAFRDIASVKDMIQRSLDLLR